MILSAAFALAASDPSAVRAQATGTPEKMLAQYRDKSRVLLVFTPTAQDPAYVEQTKLWKNEKAEFGDRQLALMPLVADAPAKPDADLAAALAKKFSVDAKTFTVVLIGKDGHDAYRSGKPLKPETLYGVIDAMPMRRAEMKQRSQTPAAPTATPIARKPDSDHDE